MDGKVTIKIPVTCPDCCETVTLFYPLNRGERGPILVHAECHRCCQKDTPIYHDTGYAPRASYNTYFSREVSSVELRRLIEEAIAC